MSRAQYAHVLTPFSHKSYPQAPQRCLAAFDELQALGLEAFSKRHDPYWDLPLNEALPQVSGFRFQVSGVEGQGVEERGGAPTQSRRGRNLKSDTRNLTPAPQLPLDLGATTPPAQQVLDFAAASAARQPAHKAAEASAGDVAEHYERVRALLTERGHLTSGEVQRALGADAALVRALLKRLVEDGLARVEGEKRGTRYVAVTSGG